MVPLFCKEKRFLCSYLSNSGIKHLKAVKSDEHSPRCLEGFLSTLQGAIKQLNLHQHADSVNSPHKDVNSRNDVFDLFSVVTQMLINLHASLKWAAKLKPRQTSLWISLQWDQTRQCEQCDRRSHQWHTDWALCLRGRKIAELQKTYLTVSWWDHGLHCWVTVMGLRRASRRLLED